MALFSRKLEMILATFLWMLASGPSATCSAFLMLTGGAAVTLRSEHSSSSVYAQKPTVEATRIFLASGAENDTLLPVSSRRNMITTSVMIFAGASQIATKANADVSDGNSLPEGAQQFARTIKLKTDLKVWNAVLNIDDGCHMLTTFCVFYVLSLGRDKTVTNRI